MLLCVSPFVSALIPELCISLSHHLCLCFFLCVSGFPSPERVWPWEVEFRSWHQCPGSNQGHLSKHRTSCRAGEGGGRFCSGTTLSPPNLSWAGARFRSAAKGNYPHLRPSCLLLPLALSAELHSQGHACGCIDTPCPSLALVSAAGLAHRPCLLARAEVSSWAPPQSQLINPPPLPTATPGSSLVSWPPVSSHHYHVHLASRSLYS